MPKIKPAAQKARPCLQVTNLSYKQGDVEILKDISFSVKEGEYLGIIGPNGGGKTTLIKLILDIIKPTKGTVTMHGEPIHSMKNRSRIGYVPQRSSQSLAEFPATVEEIVESGRTAHLGLLKKFRPPDREKIEWAMQSTGVIDHRRKLISQLSGGERQRVFIARALAGEPDILVLDEPTIAVDIAATRKFYQFLSELRKKLGLTILFVSHDLDIVAREVDTVLCLNKTLVCHGTPKESFQQKNLKKLYGESTKYVDHDVQHHHDHHEH